jgi:diamine N-acetyltransferase
MMTTIWPQALSGNLLRESAPELAAMLERTATGHNNATLNRSSIITLREMGTHDVRAVCLLDVGPGQENLVAPNAVSIAQAHFHPVGFAMLEDWSVANRAPPQLYEGEPYVSLWRFMIDHRFQKLGFGDQALRLLIDHAASRPSVRTMLLSFGPKANNPEPFYKRFGFERTGAEEDGEVVMRLRFA